MPERETPPVGTGWANHAESSLDVYALWEIDVALEKQGLARRSRVGLSSYTENSQRANSAVFVTSILKSGGSSRCGSIAARRS